MYYTLIIKCQMMNINMRNGVITQGYHHLKHMSNKILIGVILFLLGHICVFFQLNGQFKWEWFNNNKLALVLLGVPISYIYLMATKYTVEGLDGIMWPARFIGFSIGMVVYAFGVSHFFNQGITLKVAVSLALAFTLLCIQIFWK